MKKLAFFKCFDIIKIVSFIYAGMAELADAPDLGSGEQSRAGSSPVTRTKPI